MVDRLEELDDRWHDFLDYLEEHDVIRGLVVLGIFWAIILFVVACAFVFGFWAFLLFPFLGISAVIFTATYQS